MRSCFNRRALDWWIQSLVKTKGCILHFPDSKNIKLNEAEYVPRPTGSHFIFLLPLFLPFSFVLLYNSANDFYLTLYEGILVHPFLKKQLPSHKRTDCSVFKVLTLTYYILAFKNCLCYLNDFNLQRPPRCSPPMRLNRFIYLFVFLLYSWVGHVLGRRSLYLLFHSRWEECLM